MNISAANQLSGVISGINAGTVNAVVTVELGGAQVHALISTATVHEMGLQVGREAIVIVHESLVMIARGAVNVSARNCLKGRLLSIVEGAVSDYATIEVGGGHVLTTNITRDSVEQLGLRVGMEVTAIFKAMGVMLAVPQDQ